MLDSRTSSVISRKAEPAAPRAKGSNLLDSLVARQAAPDARSFGETLSDALSDRKAGPAEAARSRQAPQRKPLQREGRSDRPEPAKDAATSAPVPSADKADPAQTPAEAPRPTEATPEARTAPADVQATQTTDASVAAQQQVVAADAAVQGAVGTMPAIAGSAEDVAAASPQAGQGGATSVQPQAAQPADAGLAPLQWMARQQAAKANVKTPGSPQAADPVQADGTGGPAKQESGGIDIGKLRQQPDGSAAARNPLADLLGKATADALDVRNPPREKTMDPQALDLTAATAPRDLSAPAVQHSATGDPMGLLNQVGLQAAGGTTEVRTLQPAAHAAAASAGSALTDGAALVPADADEGRNMQRLATVVHAAVGQHQSVTRMQLQPPELGAVAAVLQLRQSRMDLKLEVASEAARDLVTGGLDKLRDSLQQQGISLDRVTVSVAPRSEHPTGDQQQSAGNGQQGHSSGQFDPGHGRQQDEPDRRMSFAIDSPIGATAVGADASAAAVSYLAGLNVLA